LLLQTRVSFLKIAAYIEDARKGEFWLGELLGSWFLARQTLPMAQEKVHRNFF
jgi:hypothetical protein